MLPFFLSQFSYIYLWRLEREHGETFWHTLVPSHSRWYCFVGRASVLSCYASWRRQMFFGSSFLFSCSACQHFETLRNPTFVTEIQSACFWCREGTTCFHLKFSLTGVPEEADNVFCGEYSSCCCGPDGKLLAKLKKPYESFFFCLWM